MKIIEYKTASGRTVEQLDREVNRLLQEGYQPYDGPYLVAAKDAPGATSVCQAMMKVSGLQQQKPKLESN
jgi:hypothetical protein